MGFFDDLADNLESNFSLFATIKLDIMSENQNALTIRRYQSGPSQRFMNGTRDDLIGFQLLVRHTDQVTAINTIETLSEYLEKLKAGNITSSDGSYEFLSCDLYVHPLLVEKTDHGAYLYSVLFQAKVYKH